MLGARRQADLALAALSDLRAARIRHRSIGPLDIAAGVAGTAIVALFATPVVAAALRSTQPGMPPPWAVAATAALLITLTAAAIRSGHLGGPLALESAFVFIVLLAPIDRALALRPIAVRQLMLGAIVGAALATVAATLLTSRLPGLRTGGACAAGALAGTFVVAVAVLTASVRFPRWGPPLLSLAGSAWPALDTYLQRITSPMTAIASLPWGHLSVSTAAYATAATSVVAYAAVERLGHISIERTLARTRNADQLRVALGLNDLRTAILLWRRRSIEAPRSRPWTHPPKFLRRFPVALRSTHALLRWPARRIARFAASAVLVGVIAATTHATPAAGAVLVVVPFLAALDAIDSLAEELDHPSLMQTYPVSRSRLFIRHLAAPLALGVAYTSTAALAATLMSRGRAAPLACALVLPAAIAMVASAAITAQRVARPLTTERDLGLPPEAVVARILLRVVSPLLPLAATVLPPVVTAGSIAIRIGATLPGLVASLAVLVWFAVDGSRWVHHLPALVARRGH